MSLFKQIDTHKHNDNFNRQSYDSKRISCEE